MTQPNDDPEGDENGKVVLAKDIAWESKDVPYDQFDPEVVELCKTINEFPGIVTFGSCQGFINDHHAGEPWHVHFGCDGLPTLEGFASLEFLVYVKREAMADGFDLYVGVGAPPPMMNGICKSLYFFYECNTRHPTDFATFLRDMRDKFFCIPDTSSGGDDQNGRQQNNNQ